MITLSHLTHTALSIAGDGATVGTGGLGLGKRREVPAWLRGVARFGSEARYTDTQSQSNSNQSNFIMKCDKRTRLKHISEQYTIEQY